MTAWYKKGNEAKSALERAEALTKMLKEKSVPWFWLKADTQADIIFVDDDGFWCEVHTIKQGGKFLKATCSNGIKPCPLCLKDPQRPAGIVFFTIIDLRQYVKKDGTVVKFTKVLLPARRTLAKQIFEFKEKYKSLVGLRFTLKRYSDKDASCGIIVGEAHRKDDGKLKKYDLLKLGKEYAVPYNYEVVLAPPTDEELEALGFILPESIGDSPLEELEEDINETPEELEEDTDEEDVDLDTEDVGIDEEDTETEDTDFDTEDEVMDIDEEDSKKKSKIKKVKAVEEDLDNLDEEEGIDADELEDIEEKVVKTIKGLKTEKMKKK